jgi:hypothetical protein
LLNNSDRLSQLANPNAIARGIEMNATASLKSCREITSLISQSIAGIHKDALRVLQAECLQQTIKLGDSGIFDY